VVARLNANTDYRQLFARAFGGRQPITGEQLGKALAAFQRSLTANNAPFDRTVPVKVPSGFKPGGNIQ
jgi:cytochrome c peroxidase